MKGVFVRLETFVSATAAFDRLLEVIRGFPASFVPGPRRSGRGGGA